MSQFLDYPGWNEIIAPQTKVEAVAKAHSFVKDDGSRPGFQDHYCGFIDFDLKIVWIARAPECPIQQVREHEECHLLLGSSRAAAKFCGDHFRTSPNNSVAWQAFR